MQAAFADITALFTQYTKIATDGERGQGGTGGLGGTDGNRGTEGGGGGVITSGSLGRSKATALAWLQVAERGLSISGSRKLVHPQIITESREDGGSSRFVRL